MYIDYLLKQARNNLNFTIESYRARPSLLALCRTYIQDCKQAKTVLNSAIPNLEATLRVRRMLQRRQVTKNNQYLFQEICEQCIRENVSGEEYVARCEALVDKLIHDGTGMPDCEIAKIEAMMQEHLSCLDQIEQFLEILKQHIDALMVLGAYLDTAHLVLDRQSSVQQLENMQADLTRVHVDLAGIDGEIKRLHQVICDKITNICKIDPVAYQLHRTSKSAKVLA